MVLEEIALSIKCNADGFVDFNISLPSVNDWDVAKSQRDNSSRQNIDNIGSLVPVPLFASELDLKERENVHQIDFRQNTNRPRPLWVHFTSHL